MTQKSGTLVVVRATRTDLSAVIQLLLDAQRWQMREGVDVWQEVDPKIVEANIASGHAFVAKVGDTVCGTVTLMDSDPLVWASDQTNAVYIHRLASSRNEIGYGIGAKILQWVKTYAKQRGKTRLRLDTWNTNRKMRAYYEKLGFRHVRDVFFPLDSPLPADYRGTHKSLYELELDH